MRPKIKINQATQVVQLMNDLNNLYRNLTMCRLTRNEIFSGIPEYILFTALSFSKLESVCRELEAIIDKWKFMEWETR